MKLFDSSKLSILLLDWSDDGGGSESQNLRDISRKEMGLDWMLRPKDTMEKTPATVSDKQQEVQVEAEEVSFQCI